MPALTTARRADIARQFDTCSILPERLPAVNRLVAKILQHRAEYEAIAAVCGIPWYFVAAIHARESTLDFGTHLHNGDPLTRRTYHVPANRPPYGSGPYSFVESAEDALQMKKLINLADITIANLLWQLECYNGLGYRSMGIPSPYIWSFTDKYSQGKYTADSHFDPKAIDEQVGVAAILLRLYQLGEISLRGVPVKVSIDGKPRPVDAFVIRGNTMIAARALATAVGATIPAVGDAGVTVSYGGKQSTFPLANFAGTGFVDASDVVASVGRVARLDAATNTLVITGVIAPRSGNAK